MDAALRLLLAYFCIAFVCGYSPHSKENVNDAAYWRNQALNRLKTKWSSLNGNSLKKAKNVILFLGDGMGVVSIAGARIYRGQKPEYYNQYGTEQVQLNMEMLPVSGFAQTYSALQHVTDSAASSTAFHSSVKTGNGMIGVTADTNLKDCPSSLGKDVFGIANWTLLAGKSVGIVTTTRVTHATPAGAFAHTANRDWESDLDMKGVPNADQCKDIAWQLMKEAPGNQFKVILGGGRGKFLSNNASDPDTYKWDGYKEEGWWKATNGTNPKGQRMDEDLTKYWQNRGSGYKYITNRDELMEQINGNFKDTEALMGLFDYDHMQYVLVENKPQWATNNPSLAEMTEAAIKMLSKSDNGFYLLVEGGKIDIAEHVAMTKVCFEELLAFDEAIARALNITNPDETLIVVTADHSHTLNMAGYPLRTENILGKLNGAEDNLPYTVFAFANGVTAPINQSRKNVTDDNTMDDFYQMPSMVPLGSETHGGENVPIFARGPLAELFQGTIDNTFIPMAIASALCVGPTKDVCETEQSTEQSTKQTTTSNNRAGNDNKMAATAMLMAIVFFWALVTNFELLI